ncbi:hypothetical protein J2P12_04390 [Candidatus Bathyarchaeota archaeon]|nr:hypothetical protein [Candidatus Bathyarchaeota archaeon]
MLFFLVYDTAIRAITSGNAPEFSGGFSYYAIGSSIFFIAMSLMFGGLFVMKSDRDYLLTLPLSRRDLSLSLFIAQFIGSGITILFLYGFYVAGAGSLTTTIILVINLVLLACVVTALGVISNILQTWKRAVLAIVLGVWCFSSVLGFAFTPVSAFSGEVLYGSIVLLAVAAITVPIALNELAYLELGSIRSLIRSTSSEYKKNVSFSGKGPIRVIYSYHLSFLEFMGRMNIGGSTSYRTARVKTRTVFAICVAVALVYLFLIGLSPLAGSHLRLAGSPLNAAVFVVPVFMGAVTLVLMSQGTFANERGWLAFTAMDPATYLRHLLLSRVVSVLAIIGPFGVADIVLGLFGTGQGFEAAIVLLVTVPAASIFATYIVARLGAVQQVREEGMMPGQFDLRQFLVILPVYFVIGLIIVSEISILASILIAGVLTIVAASLLISASVWRGIAYRLTERGFV